MRNEKRKMINRIQYARPGIVLLVTLVLLVVLSALMFTLSTRMSAQRHRNKYIIDYQAARYACDSAVKYALATLNDMNTPMLIERPNEPDFSDLFALDETEYQELLAQWRIESELAGFDNGKTPVGKADVDDVNGVGPDKRGIAGFDDPNSLAIRGPYGPPWPFVTEPVEFEIGSTTVRLEIEDENAKYPLGWALLDVRELKREAEAGFETFCELTGLDAGQIDSLKEQLQEIGTIKPFKLSFKPITKTVKRPAKTATSTRSRTTTRTSRATKPYRKTISVAEQMAEQTTHFAKLFHSSLIDAEALAKPTIVSESRNESALKYMGTWGTHKVNINTAPRHVLEAAFTFGGNEVEIAEQIIQLRRENAFATIADLEKELFRYSDSIDKCKAYIITASRFFTIRITAVSGVAKASSIIAITKDGKIVKRVAVING